MLRPGLAWPKLAAIGCWKGGTVGAYLTRFDTLFPQQPPIRDFGYYATELRGSVPLSDQGDAGAVAVGTNVLEFHPAGDDRAPEGRELLPVERLEEGQRYFVYVTTASGLYRYDMNDIVEVTGHYGKTPLIRFIQKGKGVVSFTGEKLYETQVIAAVDQAFAALRGRYHFIAAVAELVGRDQSPARLPDRVRRRRSPIPTARRWSTGWTRRWGTRTASTRPSGSRCATAPPSSGSCALASSTGTAGAWSEKATVPTASSRSSASPATPRSPPSSRPTGT